MTGFAVVHETFDDVLERHGARDEVYLDAIVVAPGGTRFYPATRIFGDVNRNADHVRAGSVTRVPLVGANGGLTTGDVVQGEGDPLLPPTTRPLQTNTRPGELDRLPIVLWEGTLREGERPVVIVPAIFESDHKLPPSSTWLFAELAAASAAPHEVESAVARLMRHPRGDDPHDRPIGMIAAGEEYVWQPQAIVLRYGSVEEGEVALQYEDDVTLGGAYTLSLRIERTR
ncbi:MAG TPA: hypothetical protein VF111_10095 [Thermoanaerobaculia bacterium]